MSHNNKYYMITIVPRTMNYMYSLQQKNKYDSTMISPINYNMYKYIYEPFEFDNNSNYYDDDKYKIRNFEHNNLKYIIEIIELSINKLDECNKLAYKNSYMKRIQLFNRRMLHIPLEENIIVSKKLESCFRNNFGIYINIIMNSIIRNTIIYSHNKRINCANIIHKIINLEKIYNKNFNLVFKKESEHLFYEQLFNICGNIYDNSGLIKVSPKYDYETQFIYMPGVEYIKNPIKENEKYHIWYTPCNIKNINDIINILNNIEKLVVNIGSFFYQKEYRGFQNVRINKKQFGEIMDISDNRDLDIVLDNYIYNIASFIRDNTYDHKKYY